MLFGETSDVVAIGVCNFIRNSESARDKWQVTASVEDGQSTTANQVLAALTVITCSRIFFSSGESYRSRVHGPPYSTGMSSSFINASRISRAS